jgi:phospholipase/carboxylesterase
MLVAKGHVMEPTVIWRRPAKRGPSTPLIVFLHGRGADEHDLMSIADELPGTYAYASVRAPVALAEGGYTWFENRGAARPIAASLRASVTMLRAWLDGAEVAQYNRERTYVLGFSAGMMMGAALLLDDPARLAGAVLLSGAIPFDAGIDAPAQHLAGKPVFYGRGSMDDVIPRELVMQSERYLREKSGVELTFREYPIGHSISETELEDIADWFEVH